MCVCVCVCVCVCGGGGGGGGGGVHGIHMVTLSAYTSLYNRAVIEISIDISGGPN